jgi:hypothetical protein
MTDEGVRGHALRLVNGAREAVGVDVLHDLPRGIKEQVARWVLASLVKIESSLWRTRPTN